MHVEEELMELEVENCVRCNGDGGSGKLLVCSHNGCPIALHEECMCAKPVFDQTGNFYCPYCAYKREFTRARELRRKAMGSKNVLSKFIDAGDGNGPSGCGCVEDGLGGVGGGGVREPEEESDVHGGGERIDEGQQEEEEGTVVEETQEVEAEIENAFCVQETTNKDNACSGLDQAGVRVCEENEEQMQPKTSDEGPANGTVVPESEELGTGSPLVRKKRFKKKANRKERPQDVASLKKGPSPSREPSSRQTSSVEEDPKNQNERDKTLSKKEKQLQEFARTWVLPNGKRKRLDWSDEEIEMLKEGVRIYSRANQNMPWKEILEFGQTVFHITRTPTDLKDIWRRSIVKRVCEESKEQMQSKTSEEGPANGTVMPESDKLDTVSPLVPKKRLKKKARKKEQPQDVASLRTRPSPSRERSSRRKSSVEEDPKNQNEKDKTLSKKEKELQIFARILPNGKRKRLSWSDEEIEMLKEGVRMYSRANQNIPWTEVLEYGQNVFHVTRTALDLRDKWRRSIVKS